MPEVEWHTMEPVGADYADHAPVVWRVEERVSAPRRAVWDAFADASTWNQWFPHVEWARYEGDPPWGVGTVRKSCVAGALHDETLVVWDELSRWGYVVNRATQPLSVSQLEVNEFEDIPGGTLVRWILACDPLEGMTFLAGDRPMQEFLGEMFAGAMRHLEKHLGKSG